MEEQVKPTYYACVYAICENNTQIPFYPNMPLVIRGNIKGKKGKGKVVPMLN
jgi:hypothetical protein